MRKRVLYIILGLLVALIILLESFSQGFSHNADKMDRDTISHKLEMILDRE